jgi:hypothetical protein
MAGDKEKGMKKEIINYRKEKGGRSGELHGIG